jgi:transcriptional regulator with XRE-family HTH domain
MKLGDVLRKERERRALTVEEVAWRLGIEAKHYEEMEAGNSPAEEWGRHLAHIAIQLQTPTARLIAKTGKSAEARQAEGQCGRLIALNREKRGISREELGSKLGISVAEVESVEQGNTPLETYAPILLSFSEAIEQPVFNLFYPCGLPLEELTDYP